MQPMVPEAVAVIREKNAQINAYVSTRLEAAVAEAQRRASESPRSSIHGVAYGLKDEWETLSLPTTAGSYRHRDRQSPKNGAVFEAFDKAGAILVGKTNLSDMGLAPEANNYLVGPTRNPFDLSRTAGGSSGGAAAAVAVGMQAFDWGTDIGGSIRMPAAFCKVFGLRLSSETWPCVDMFPRVPRVLDYMCGQGPITQTLADMHGVLDAAAPLRTGPERSFEPRGVIVHAPDHRGRWPTFVDDAVRVLKPAFDEIVTQSSLPGTRHTADVYAGMWASHLDELVEAEDGLTITGGLKAALSALVFRGKLGNRYFHGQCAEIVLLIALGRMTLYRNKSRARQRAQAVRDAFGQAWDDGYVIAAPVCCYPPPKIGRSNCNPRLLHCTFPGNLSDATGLSIPCGQFEGGLPRGIQILGPPGSERQLLDLAHKMVNTLSSE